MSFSRYLGVRRCVLTLLVAMALPLAQHAQVCAQIAGASGSGNPLRDGEQPSHRGPRPDPLTSPPMQTVERLRAPAKVEAPRQPVALMAMSTQIYQPQQTLEPAPLPRSLPRSPSEEMSPQLSPTTGELPYAPVPLQAWANCAPQCRCGVNCPTGNCSDEPHWRASRPIPWQMFAQGEYVGPARLAHVPEYRLRVDDIIRVVYGLTGAPSARPYELSVGDIIRVEALGSPNVDRQVTVQPDGMVTMQLLGQVPAAGHSIEELRKDLESRYQRYIRQPAISVTPVKLNTRVEELRASVDQRYGTGGQGVFVRVTPSGFIQLPAIGSVPAQGLLLDEVKREIEARYARRFHGIEVTPVLDRRAPRYVFVLGEVKSPGRIELDGPTTAIQAIAMAGSWNVGADLRQVVVFRRDDCWRLMATRLDLRPALGGRRPCPPDEIWIRDADIVLVPKSDLLKMDDFIELAFTRGLYGVVPLNVGLSWTSLSAL